ncbi:hypothetical protein ACWY4P_30730 [Streptomyces sp. LZ34]
MTEHARSADDSSTEAEYHPMTADSDAVQEAVKKAWGAFITHAALCHDSCLTHGRDCGHAALLREKWRAARAKIGETETK